jgi:hypothetical protein
VSEDLTFTTPPNSAPENVPDYQTISIVANSDGSIAGTTVTSSGKSCALKYTTSGSTATLQQGQTCSPVDLSLTYSQGTATVNGTNLEVTLGYAFSGTLTSDAGTIAVAGNGVSEYTCQRK